MESWNWGQGIIGLLERPDVPSIPAPVWENACYRLVEPDHVSASTFEF